MGLPYPNPYMDTPGARGSSRKPKGAKNGITPPTIRIFPGNTVLELWVAAPDPLHGHSGGPWKLADSHGSPRKPNEAKNGLIPPRFRILPGDTVLELRVAVPDPLTWTHRKPAEAKNIISPSIIRIFTAKAASEIRVTAPDSLHGQAGSPRKLTEARNIVIPPRMRKFPGRVCVWGP